MTGKRPWQSRTIALNGTVALLNGLLAGFAVLLGADGRITAVTLCWAVYAAVQVWLRFDTRQPIIVRGPVTVAHVGGIEFDGAATVTGALAGETINEVHATRTEVPDDPTR